MVVTFKVPLPPIREYERFAEALTHRPFEMTSQSRQETTLQLLYANRQRISESRIVRRSTVFKIETKSDLLANRVDNRRNCRHIHMLDVLDNARHTRTL